MRKIIEIVAGYGIDVSKDIDLNKIKIDKLWTLYDEDRMWECNKFNPYTGEKIERGNLEVINLQHHEGVFLEDLIHDWKVRNGKLDYYSRTVIQGGKVKILIEYENIG